MAEIDSFRTFLDRLQDQCPRATTLRVTAPFDAAKGRASRTRATSHIGPEHRLPRARRTTTPSTAAIRSVLSLHRLCRPSWTITLRASRQACRQTCSADTHPTNCAMAPGPSIASPSCANVLGVMDEFAPGFSSRIIDMQVLLPTRSRRHVRAATRPHLPRRAAARSALLPTTRQRITPITGQPIRQLYLCGSSAHTRAAACPAFPDTNAAREILKDRKGWR